jgi:hypothetical protein
MYKNLIKDAINFKLEEEKNILKMLSDNSIFAEGTRKDIKNIEEDLINVDNIEDDIAIDYIEYMKNELIKTKRNINFLNIYSNELDTKIEELSELEDYLFNYLYKEKI